MDGAATWTATALAAKVFADQIRRSYAFATPGLITSARRTIEIDIAYGIAFAVGLLLVVHIGVAAGLAAALVLRVGGIAADRVVLSGNHPILELYLLLVCFRLHEVPVALASVLQVMTVSVWLYSVAQKLYHRQFHDGFFFYVTMQFSPPILGRGSKYLKRVLPFEGAYGSIDMAVLAYYRRLATLVLVSEAVPPLFALAASGTIWSTLLLVGVSVPVGVLTGETNFMITNLLLAAVFLEPFSTSALLRALSDPVVASVVVWCLVWPPLHAVLSRRLRFNPWKLAGWGMYSCHWARADVVDHAGEIRAVLGTAPPITMLRLFGACRIAWVRDSARRYFLRWAHQGAVSAVIFRWCRRRGRQFVTSCVVVPNALRSEPIELEISDEFSAAAFQRYIARCAEPSHEHPASTTDPALGCLQRL